jgi:hypothetical protein
VILPRAWVRAGTSRVARSISRGRRLWLRPQVTYPSLHHRYAHDLAHVFGLRVFGVRAEAGRLRWSFRRTVVSVMAVLCPVAGAVFLTSWARPPPTPLAIAYYGWLGYYAFLIVVVTAFSWWGVKTFHDLTPQLERMLTADGRNAYDRWANITTATGPQVSFAVLFSAAALAALRGAASVPGMSQRLYISPASYMSILIFGFFIAGGVYWIVAGTVLSVVLTRRGHLTLHWYSPAHTPGIELLARCYRLAFYGSCVGVALCLFPLLTWAYKGPDSTLLFAIKVGLFLSAMTAALLIAVIPQWRLSTVVSEQRRNAITELHALLPATVQQAVRGSQSDPAVLAWLEVVSATPSTTVKESTIAGVLLGLATALLPYIVKLLT